MPLNDFERGELSVWITDLLYLRRLRPRRPVPHRPPSKHAGESDSTARDPGDPLSITESDKARFASKHEEDPGYGMLAVERRPERQRLRRVQTMAKHGRSPTGCHG